MANSPIASSATPPADIAKALLDKARNNASIFGGMDLPNRHKLLKF